MTPDEIIDAAKASSEGIALLMPTVEDRAVVYSVVTTYLDLLYPAENVAGEPPAVLPDLRDLLAADVERTPTGVILPLVDALAVYRAFGCVLAITERSSARQPNYLRKGLDRLRKMERELAAEVDPDRVLATFWRGK